MGARDDLLAIPDEVLRSGRIGQAALVHMDFLGSPQRWWTGFGDLTTGGHTWKGLGDLISISEITTSYDLSARQVTFTLAATTEMVNVALAAKTMVRDRPVTVWMQLFAVEEESGVPRGQPLGSPFVMYSGIMTRMPWSATGPDQRTLQVEAEGIFFRRNAPPRGLWTDSDQKARHPGDKGLERLPLYSAGYAPRWI